MADGLESRSSVLCEYDFGSPACRWTEHDDGDDVYGELDREEAGEEPVVEIERAGGVVRRNFADAENKEAAVDEGFVVHEGHDVEA